MLRFFLKYRNWIIVSSIGLAMIAFVLSQSLPALLRSAGQSDQTIGTIDGEKVVVSDRQTASAEIDLIYKIARSYDGGQVLQFLATDDSGLWMLMVKEAEQMGLSASDFQVDDLFLNTFKLAGGVDQAAAQMQSSPAFVRQAIRHWIMVQDYRELVLGMAHLSIDERMDSRPGTLRGAIAEINRLAQQGMMDSAYVQQIAQMILGQAYLQSLGEPRISTPMLQRLLSDLGSSVKVDMLMVPAEQLVDADAPADPAIMQQLFDQYKDNLPGTGEDYGFGYAFPDRVKLEYLYLPFDQVLNKINIEVADVYAQYDENKEQYRRADDAPTGAGEIPPFEEVRQQITDELRTQKAVELANKIMNKAQAILIDNARSLQKEDGYYVTKDWTPMELGEVSRQISEEFKVSLHITKRGRSWQDAEDLAKLPSITPEVAPGLVDYIMSVHELDTENKHPLASRRLQVNIPSLPLRSPANNDMWLIRINDVDKEHSPATIDEVRAKVQADAKLYAAYQKLIDQAETWKQRAITEGLETLAEELDSEVITSDTFSRRRETLYEGTLVAPDVEPVGSDEKFVDAVFELADQVTAADKDIEEIPLEDRTDVIPIDGKQSLVLVRLNQVFAITQSAYNSQVQIPGSIRSANRMLSNETVGKESFEYDTIKKRVGFIPSRDEEAEAETENAEDETQQPAEDQDQPAES